MYLQKWNDWIFGSLIFNSSASIKLNVITFLILYVGSFEAYISIDIKNGAHEETVDKKFYAVHYRDLFDEGLPTPTRKIHVGAYFIPHNLWKNGWGWRMFRINCFQLIITWHYSFPAVGMCSQSYRSVDMSKSYYNKLCLSKTLKDSYIWNKNIFAPKRSIS